MSIPYAEVIGDPIAHSKSPLIHKFWLVKLGIDGDYRAIRVTKAELPDYFASRRVDPNWRGCNVTVPHKIAALHHACDPGKVKQLIGATNTVFRGDHGDRLIATNTDAAGFHASIASLDLIDREVAVVGAGGAARAVLFALARMVGRGDRPRGPAPRVGRVTVLSRSPHRAAALLDMFSLSGEALPLSAAMPPVVLLVNASSLGMVGQPPLALDLTPLPANAVAYDCVYAPLRTDMLVQAKARGLDTIDGLSMLVAQAASAFGLFFGADPPREHDAELRALLNQ